MKVKKKKKLSVLLIILLSLLDIGLVLQLTDIVNYNDIFKTKEEIKKPNKEEEFIPECTPVPTSGYIDTIYINTSMDKDVVLELFDDYYFTKDNSNYYFYFVAYGGGNLLRIDRDYDDPNYLTIKIQYNTNPITWTYLFDYNKGGWISDVDKVEIKANTFNSYPSYGGLTSKGTWNHYLGELFSIAPYKKEVI